MNLKSKPVLGTGQVTLLDSMGDDLRVVNMARQSFDVHHTVFEKSDERLINFLAREGHTAPFRHCYITFSLTIPEFVARQIYKHVVGIGYCEQPTNDHGWSEVSGRYIEAIDLGYHVPEEFRKQSPKNKQASIADDGGIPQELFKESFRRHNEAGIALYRAARESGICKEQAREVLSFATNTKFGWTLSLQALAHLYHLRDDSHAQGETQEVIQVMKELTTDFCPISLQALINEFNRKKFREST